MGTPPVAWDGGKWVCGVQALRHVSMPSLCVGLPLANCVSNPEVACAFVEAQVHSVLLWLKWRGDF